MLSKVLNLRILRVFLVFLVVTGGFFSIVATTPGIDDDSTFSSDEANDRKLQQGAVFVPGNDIILETATMDDAGGTIVINGTGTYLDGAEVYFPPGALAGSTVITVGYNDGQLTLPSGVSSAAGAQTLVIHADGVALFSQLVEITIPYTDPDNLPTPFYVDDEGQLRPVLVINIDTVNQTITFATGHASLWTWLIDFFTDSPDEDTRFRPLDDGFKIANHGSTIHPGGECFGMTTFAQWYYDEKMTVNGDFYNKYMSNVGADSAGNNLTGQDVIATRAFSAANQSWNWSQFILPNINTTDKFRFNAICNALKTTKRPVNLSIKRVDGDGNFIGGHAVLAYGVDKDDGQLFIYDPNHPGSVKEILYDTGTKTFQGYGNYTKFFLNGTGTYDLREAYENIFQDAEHNFTTDNMPHIAITSHQNGETVDERNVELTGQIESSEVLVRQLDVFAGADKFSTNVDTEGNFSVAISLAVGEQTLRFVAKDISGNPITPNNLDANPFSLILGEDLSVMLVTLTWGQGRHRSGPIRHRPHGRLFGLLQHDDGGRRRIGLRHNHRIRPRALDPLDGRRHPMGSGRLLREGALLWGSRQRRNQLHGVGQTLRGHGQRGGVHRNRISFRK